MICTYLKCWGIALLCLYSLMTQAQSLSPTDSTNYVLTQTARIEVSSKADFDTIASREHKSAIIQYLDGLGRPIQTIDWQSAPDKSDIVSFNQYDQFGREVFKFLPFNVHSTNGGQMVDDPFTSLQGFYQPNTSVDYATTAHPWAETQFEASPVNRVLEQGAPGTAWQPTGLVGTPEIDNHSVVSYFYVNQNGGAVVQTLENGEIVMDHSTPGDDYGQLTYDENNNWTATAKNKQGLTIVQSGHLSPNDPDIVTVFAYDQFDRIKYIIQPVGFNLLDNLGPPPITISHADPAVSSILDQYAFQYEYDERGRISRKKVPGADWVYMVYDSRDRLRLSQDGTQRTRNEWSFTRYDELDRPIMTGLFTTPLDQSALRAQIDQATALSEKALPITVNDGTSQSITGYTSLSYPQTQLSGVEVLSITYYDDYDFNRDGNLIGKELPTYESDIWASVTEMNEIISTRNEGMITGIRIKVLDAMPDMPQWLWTVTFYDKYGREVQTKADNHLEVHPNNGEAITYDLTTNRYNYAGELLESAYLHKSNDFSLPIRTRYTYDPQGRLITEEQKAGGQAWEVIVQNDYNALGQLRAERLNPNQDGSLPLQMIDYDYNIRGWMTDINAPSDNCLSSIDIIPPAAIQDFDVYSTDPNLNSPDPLYFRFTYPGDDGDGGGRVHKAELVFCQHPNIEDSVAAGKGDTGYLGSCQTFTFSPTQNGHILRDPGQPVFFSVIGFNHLPGPTAYWFTVRTYDEAGNVSPWSNVRTMVIKQDLQSTDHQPAGQLSYSLPACQSCDDSIATSLTVTDLDLAITVLEDPFLLGGNRYKIQVVLSDDKRISYFKRAETQTMAHSQGLQQSLSFNINFYNPTDTVNFPSSLFLQSGARPPMGLSQYDALEVEIRNLIAQSMAGTGIDPAHLTTMQNIIWKRYKEHLDDAFGENANYDLYRQSLFYEDLAQAPPNTTPQYNGNIAATSWQLPYQCDEAAYRFSYDGLNRLTSAHSSEKNYQLNAWVQHDHFNSNYTYDVNGNLLTTQRNGLLNNNAGLSFGSMDNLSYTYLGNQLTALTELNVNGSSVPGVEEFEAFTPSDPTTTYTYDPSGNLLTDANRNLIISYNHFNKPTHVNKQASDVTYIYSADGTKLRQVVSNNDGPNVGPVKQVDYVGMFQYTNMGSTGASGRTLDFYAHSKGRAVAIADTNGTYDYRYEFFLKDHLGNTRVVFSDMDGDGRINPDPLADELRQVVPGYYPFGMQHAADPALAIATLPENQYLYNGKERQDELQLGWYDYGARMYDPAIARWNGVDALAEDYVAWSPYNYVLNNPLRFVDPDGNSVSCDTCPSTIPTPSDAELKVQFNRKRFNQEMDYFIGNSDPTGTRGSESLSPTVDATIDASYKGGSSTYKGVLVDPSLLGVDETVTIEVVHEIIDDENLQLVKIREDEEVVTTSTTTIAGNGESAKKGFELSRDKVSGEYSNSGSIIPGSTVTSQRSGQTTSYVYNATIKTTVSVTVKLNGIDSLTANQSRYHKSFEIHSKGSIKTSHRLK